MALRSFREKIDAVAADRNVVRLQIPAEESMWPEK